MRKLFSQLCFVSVDGCGFYLSRFCETEISFWKMDVGVYRLTTHQTSRIAYRKL